MSEAVSRRRPLRFFALVAEITSVRPDAIHGQVGKLVGTKARIERTATGLRVVADEVIGSEARELNRRLLSGLRGLDPRARMWTAWTTDGVRGIDQAVWVGVHVRSLRARRVSGVSRQ